MDINFDSLKYFYNCLEQPKRANGGYEESRQIIFEYLFGCTYEEAKNKSSTPYIWLSNILDGKTEA